MESNYVCPICGNRDPQKIGFKNGLPYCRVCLSFRGQEAKFEHIFPKDSSYFLSYELSDEQKMLSNALVNNYKDNKNSLVHAVCGSGKTEIVLEIISYAIKCGERVGFAVPRRDVAQELYHRFKSIFSKNKVILVCGGHSDVIEGDLVCLTTHQLYRYENYFDLLVADEIDAFPFKGNELLQKFFYRSLKGRYVMMSATPSKSLIEELKKKGTEVLELFSRFHRHPLPVPEVKIIKRPFLFLYLIDCLEKFLKNNKQVLIFVPTINDCEEVYFLLRFLIKGGDCVHSKKEKRPLIIQQFREKKIKYLVTTAVLERGVTIKDLQVIVYNANHSIYDSYSLVQIAGRVGRKIDAPEGRVIFLANEKTDDMVQAIKDIEKANESLQNMLF